MLPESPDPAKDIHSPSSGKRKSAARALGNSPDKNTLDALHAALADPHAGVRTEAAIALGKREEPGSVSTLVIALNDSSPVVRQAVLQALIRIRDPGSAAPALPFLKDPDYRVRIGTIRLLGAAGTEQAIPEISLLLSDPVSDVREEAGQAIRRLLRKTPGSR